MIKTSLIAIAITIVLTIIPFSLLNNPSRINTQMHLRPLCLTHQQPQWNICVSCFQRSDDKFLNARGLVVQDTNQFKLWELPSSELISCEEILQFVDFQKTKKEYSEIVFEDSLTFEELSQKLKIVKHTQSMTKIQLKSSVQHFAVFEIGSQWNAGLSVRQISKQTLQQLKKFVLFLSQVGIVFCVLYFIYLMCFKKIVKLQLILNISVLVMLIGYWMNNQDNYSYLQSYAQGLFFCLCLMKIQSRKLVAVLFVLVFAFVQIPSFRVVGMILAILAFFVQGYDVKQTYNLMYLGACLMIFTGSKIFQNFYLEEENNNALCEIIENMILAICPIMIEVLSAIEMEDFKQFIVSEETTNQQKGFRKLQSGDGDELDEELQKK